MPITRDDSRVSFRVDDHDLCQEFRALIPHGQQKVIMNAVVKDLVRILRGPNRAIVIGLICAGDLKMEDILTPLVEHKDELK